MAKKEWKLDIWSKFFIVNTVICEWTIIAYDIYHW